MTHKEATNHSLIIIQSIKQPINQWNIQSINESINHSLNQSRETIIQQQSLGRPRRPIGKAVLRSCKFPSTASKVVAEACDAWGCWHCRISTPQHSRSLYYNYKESFSSILLALINANYKFFWVAISVNGACNGSTLRDAIKNRTIHWHGHKPQRNYKNQPIPYFIVADVMLLL